jgi:EmrB/QacA subfamily drug resistance transporter
MRRSWLVLLLICSAQFMVTLDVTVANVALPSIGRDLGFAVGDLQWVITPYVLLTGGLMLLGGRAADLLGRRAVFLTGLSVFTLASLGSGLAWSPAALVAARAVQGAGAALLLPSALSILTTTYTGEQRTRALAAWGAIASGGMAVGLLVGGLLTQLIGWQAIFLINVPVGAAVLVLSARAVAGGRAGGRVGLGALDGRGGLLLVSGLVVALYAISRADDEGWGSALTLGGLAVAVALLAGFGLCERAARRPLVPATLWRRRSLVSGAAVTLGATAIMVGAFFLNTLYLQDVLGMTALQTGLAFLPVALSVLAAAHVGSHLIGHLGSRTVLLAGLVVLAGAGLGLAFVPDHATYVTDLLWAYVLLGFGAGLTFVGVSVGAMADVAHEEAGGASGLLTTGHEVGAALGVAVLSAIATAGVNPGDLAGLADGYRSGFAVIVGLAVALSGVAAVLLPTVRPPAGARVALH